MDSGKVKDWQKLIKMISLFQFLTVQLNDTSIEGSQDSLHLGGVGVMVDKKIDSYIIYF